MLIILAATAALYYNVSKSYFCSFDDFLEVHRSAFVDASSPTMVFTTAHFSSFKYRPLNRGLNLLTYGMDHGGPGAFRGRNLFFHLLNIALIYWLAMLLRKSVTVAAAASLLFAVHPLANQPVIGAVMTNTAAYSTYLLAIIFFVLATRNKNREVIYVTLAGIFGTASLFTYESNIVVFGAMAAYVFILHFFLGQAVSKRVVIALSAVTVCSLGVVFGSASTVHGVCLPRRGREHCHSSPGAMERRLVPGSALASIRSSTSESVVRITHAFRSELFSRFARWAC